MTKVPQRDEIWRDKYSGDPIRIYRVERDYICFFTILSDGCVNLNVSGRYVFQRAFKFVGDGKPIDVLFEVQDED